MGEGSQKPAPERVVPPLLLPEVLGFVPQLLLDDIINIANNAVSDGVDGMESFLQKWADERVERPGEDRDRSKNEVEQGLVAFQTLLEFHTDGAFDIFEAWALRNIFAIPPDLPIVVPHQEGLDLTQTPEREQELMDEVEELRRKILNQRRVQRLHKRALQASDFQRRRSEERLERLSILDSPVMDVLAALPPKLLKMYETVFELPPLDPSTVAALTQFQMTEPGKREWETSKTGYLNWAVGQLLLRARSEGGSISHVDELGKRASEVGQADQLRLAFEATEGVRADLQSVSVHSLKDQDHDMES